MKPSISAKLSMQMLEQIESNPKNKMSLSEMKQFKQDKDNNDVITETCEIRDNFFNNKKKKYNFLENVKSSLLKETILHLYENSLPKIDNDNKEIIMNNLVDEFIKEEGSYNLIRNFKQNSYILAEYANIIEKYADKIIKEANSKNSFDDIGNLALKDDFFKELNLVDSEDLEDTIRTRVTNSIEDFVDNNKKDKRKINEILQKTKEKIDKNDDENIQEEMANIAKNRMTTIRNKHSMNILEAMIKNVCQSTFKNENLKKAYTLENGTLNMDLIVENCTLMYSLLETVNTSKMIRINENYLTKFLNSLKG